MVILGAGESGAGAAVLAKAKGFDVFVSDKSSIKPKYKEMLDNHGIRWEEGQHTEADILNADEIVKSPGIPDKAPIIQLLKKQGTPIISEIEFAGRYTDSKMICITGSNGKTTTTMLTYHILKEAGVDVGLAGNVGNSLALQVAEYPHAVYVIELSSFQLDNMYRRMRRLICFDMDSTLIETEVIDELAIRAGVGEQVKAITERAMRGEIDFTESFRERVALLKGLDESVMQEIAENLPITEGVDRLMYVLKKYGYKIAILSGGFTYFGHYLQQKYGIDYVYANELEIENGKLTGRYLGDVVDGKRKAELLRLIAQVEKVDIAQTIAVGDGANDLPMLGIAGLGIAFHAKPKVVANAKQSINTIGLDGVLYFLGFKDSYIDIPR
mgnify:CR=1 FL=1